MRSKGNKVKAKVKPMADLTKIGATINAKIEYNESIVEAYEFREKFLEISVADESIERGKKTLFAIELAELKHKIFFQKDVLESWKKRGVEHEMNKARALKESSEGSVSAGSTNNVNKPESNSLKKA